MLDRVARLPGEPCLLARGTQLGGIAFYHVNGSCRAIPANQSEMSLENNAGRGDFFCSYHWPVLSAKQNDSQSEEFNIIDGSQAENRPVPVQEAESFFGGPFCLLCLAAAQQLAQEAHSLSPLGELHVKEGYVSTLLAG